MDNNEKLAIDNAVEQFRHLMEGQLARAKRIKEEKDFVDYQNLDTIVIGICGGDGIGPIITKESERDLAFLLKDEVASGKLNSKKLTDLLLKTVQNASKQFLMTYLKSSRLATLFLKAPQPLPVRETAGRM